MALEKSQELPFRRLLGFDRKVEIGAIEAGDEHRRITAEDIPALGADAVVLAAGAEPIAPDISGDIPVMTPHEFIREGHGDALSAVVWDQAGGVIGAGAACHGGVGVHLLNLS